MVDIVGSKEELEAFARQVAFFFRVAISNLYVYCATDILIGCADILCFCRSADQLRPRDAQLHLCEEFWQKRLPAGWSGTHQAL